MSLSYGWFLKRISKICNAKVCSGLELDEAMQATAEALVVNIPEVEI